MQPGPGRENVCCQQDPGDERQEGVGLHHALEEKAKTSEHMTRDM